MLDLIQIALISLFCLSFLFVCFLIFVLPIYYWIEKELMTLWSYDYNLKKYWKNLHN